jgi:hypothetical protein
VRSLDLPEYLVPEKALAMSFMPDGRHFGSETEIPAFWLIDNVLDLKSRQLIAGSPDNEQLKIFKDFAKEREGIQSILNQKLNAKDGVFILKGSLRTYRVSLKSPS